jgi:hypothetical protein
VWLICHLIVDVCVVVPSTWLEPPTLVFLGFPVSFAGGPTLPFGIADSCVIMHRVVISDSMWIWRESTQLVMG